MINLIKKHKEGILYIIFGIATTVTNWLAYCVCVELFGFSVTVSNAIACVVAITFAFVTNKLYVFQSKNNEFKTLLREISSFVASRAATGVIDIFGPAVLINLGINQTVFGIDGFVAKFVSSFVVIVLNYVFSKIFVFRKNK